MPKAVTWLALLALLPGAGCTKRSACEFDVSICPLDARLLKAQREYLFADQDTVELQVTGRTYEEDLTVYLSQGPVSQNLSERTTGPSGTNNIYSIHLNPTDFRRFTYGAFYLLVAEGSRKAPDLTLYLTSYASVGSASFGPAYPTVEYLGFAGTKLIALRSGLDGSSNPSKIIRRYGWMSAPKNMLADAEVSGDYFNMTPFGNKTLAATASMTGSVFVLRAVMTAGLELRKCDAEPGDGSSCTVYAPMLPLETQAFAVSADGTVGVVADKDGQLSYARLDQSTPLSWQGFGETPPAGSMVKLAMGDVNGDGKVDVIRVRAAGGSPQVGVLLGSESGFSQNRDSGLSTALVEAIGDPAVDALAVGDLDQDGWAEVLVANGKTVHVLYNQRGRFDDVQQLTLGPGPGDGGPKVTAIGIGKLDGTVDPSKLLDIVVASNSPPDMLGNGMLFVQSWRAK